MIRAILFDAGNTLVRMDYARIAAELASHGVTTTAEAIQRAEWATRPRIDGELFAPAAVSTESRATTERYTRYVLEAVGVDDERVMAAMIAWRRGYNQPVGLWTVAEPDAAAALALARAAGVVTGVISNSNGTIREILAGLGLAQHLDFVLDSTEEGIEKPDPRLFLRALERAGVRAVEAAYIGDLYSVDVVGARAVGIRAVLMDPGGCWGARDCPAAPSVLDAVRLLLAADGTPAPDAGRS